MEEYIIKKYSNRKLYDTKEKKYVNLSEVSRLIREGAEVKVINNKTKEDVTSLVLAQIIVEQEKTKKIMLPSIFSPLKLLKKGGEDMFKLGRKMFLGGLGLASLTKERANEIAQELIKKGELSQSESKEFVLDLMDKAEKEKDKLIEEKIKPEIDKSLEKMNFASKKCVDDLEKKIDELGNKIDQLSKKIK